MKLRVTPEQMRRVVAALTDSVSPPLRATRRLPFDFAVVTFAAGSRRSPGHPIADFQRVPGPVAFQSFTESLDTADGFVPRNDWQRDRKLALPQMNIRAADAGHLSANQCRAGFELGRQWKFAQRERRIKLREHGSFGAGHNVGDFVQPERNIQR